MTEVAHQCGTLILVHAKKNQEVTAQISKLIAYWSQFTWTQDLIKQGRSHVGKS